MLETLPHTSLLTAFLAGLVSFVSPCILPLVPSYVMVITGLSLDQLSAPLERRIRRRTILGNALCFIGGFSAIFIAFGASASFLGQLLADYQALIRKIGAVIMILFGLQVTGLVRLGFLMVEKRVHLRRPPVGFLGSWLIGATFAAGWTPCVGPILGTLLLYAATADTLADGVTLLAFYALGLGLPLLAAALGLDRCLAYLKQAGPWASLLSKASGIVLIVLGGVLYADAFSNVTAFFERYGIGVAVDLEDGPPG
ncbi:MAG: cytochrome c biogenesis protein CcdA [Nitrospira sp.]|nr:cytochrome c biogenesis protein CcdA [Nitrospira sp.]